MMKKEWILTLFSVVITVLIALGLVRWMAPGLLGYAVDQQLVQTSREVPPFYSNIFRREDLVQEQFILNDPVLLARAKPMFPDLEGMGPNDILGFRNRNVPISANIITIGDSQTYGNNAALEQNWPSFLEDNLFANTQGRIYNMSVGAWGGVNYMKILESAMYFSPQVVIVAFYSGNDAFTDFRNAYSIEEYSFLRPDPSLSTDDIPPVEMPSTPEEMSEITFSDGVTTQFTPDYRLVSNDRDNPAVLAGYAIMAETGRRMAAHTASYGAKIIFTIIPTKELAYARKIEVEGISINKNFEKLIREETQNIDELASLLKQIPGATYTDVVTPMQEAALTPTTLYPDNSNGHPLSPGYMVIANSLSESARNALVMPMLGIVGLRSGDNLIRFALLTQDGVFSVPSIDVITANGWDIEQIPVIPLSWISSLPLLGVVNETDPSRYGPEALGL